MHREVPRWALVGARLIVRWSAGWRPYVIAVVAIAISTATRAALQPWIGERLFFTTYFPAIGIVAASPMLAITAMLNVLVHWLLRQQQVIVAAKEAEVRPYETLVRELEHRMRNLFALVQRVAFRTLQGDRDEVHARNAFIDRMAALAASSRTGLGESPTVDQLLLRQVLPYGSQVEVVACERVELDPAHTQELALIFHELATNAAKYGAPPVRTRPAPAARGRARCRWSTGRWAG